MLEQLKRKNERNICSIRKKARNFGQCDTSKNLQFESLLSMASIAEQDIS